MGETERKREGMNEKGKEEEYAHIAHRHHIIVTPNRCETSGINDGNLDSFTPAASVVALEYLSP